MAILRRCVALGVALALVLPGLHAAFAQTTTQYSYDALGRVVSAIDANGKKVAYTYDSAGNRTRVSNGSEFSEILPTAWSASSNAGTTGLTAANGMRDGVFESLASIHATATEANAWIMADLGSVQSVNHIDVAPALASAVGASIDDLNDTAVEYSVDGTHWSTAATINAVAPNVTRTVALGGVAVRYLRIHRVLAGQVAIGDLRLYSAAVANSPLVANPDTIASSGSAVTFDPRTNDQDYDGYAFTVSAAEDPPHGTVTVNSGTSITYTPDAGYFGADSFLYTVADGHNGTASARVSVLIRPSTNHAPVAVPDAFVVSDRVTSTVDGTNSLRPADNDYDSDGDVLTITTKTNPSHGTATIVGSTVIQYQPTSGYTGSDTFNYTISDGRGGTSNADVTLTVGNSNPVAGPDSITVARNSSTTFDPRLNDRDPNGDAIAIGSVTQGAKGVATLNGDQTITYAANTGASGGDNFTYALNDARGGTATGSVTVSIAPNSPPQALGDNISAGASAVTFDPRANDIDADHDPLTVVSIAAPAHGTAQINSGGTSVTYTINSGYTGGDSFSYTVSDDKGATGTATVAVNSLNVEYLLVGGGGGGGGAAGGGGGGGGVRQGVTQINLSSGMAITPGSGGAANSDGGSSSLGSIASAIGGGAGGSGSVAGHAGGSGGGGSQNGSAAGSGTTGQGYAGGTSTSGNMGGGGGGGAGGPGGNATAGAGGRGGAGLDSSFAGVATNYAAGGGSGGYGNTGADLWATPGIAGGSSAGRGADSGDAGSGVANHGGGGGGGGGGEYGGVAAAGGSGVVILRYQGGPKATGGTITQAGGYTIHTFTAGGTFTATTANTPPTAANDNISTTPLAPITFDPRTNDSDTTDALAVISVTAPSHGTAVIGNAGQAITYTPASGYTGSDSFQYTISDGNGGTATATVSVTVANASFSVDYLVVAGGGGGGGGTNGGGGGGGGGVLSGTFSVSTGNYPITVGAGGAGGGVTATGGAGGASGAFGATATGGGGGRGSSGAVGNGGSGGGGNGGSIGATAGAGTSGQGNAGGAPGAFSYHGGGGGGATVAGGVSNGGQGYVSSISGASDTYGSGGGGGDATNTGGGGTGGTNGGQGTDNGGGAAVANHGGGGGGGGSWDDGTNSFTGGGGSGASGVVIIRYAGAPKATGGTITQSGGYTIHKFTSSGTFAVQ